MTEKNKKVINTDLFIQWLNEIIGETEKCKYKFANKKDYGNFLYLETTIDAYQFVLDAVTGKIADEHDKFMEEEQDREEAKDPVIENGNIICPSCSKNLGLISITKKFCKECGQRLKGRS